MTRYDAVLLVSFGGPEGPDDVVPFLENVTRGRGIPPERLAEVGAHYALFGGVSPINEQNRALVAALRERLDLPVYWGNRNWAPLLPDVVARMRDDGVGRALAVITSAYSSYSGCRQYRENIADAVAAAGPGAPVIETVRRYFDHPGFVQPFVDATVAALDELPAPARAGARLVFTTHSIPSAAAASSGPAGGAYLAQHQAVAGLVADGVAARTGTRSEWDLVFQSRSGPPEQPWLEPDISDHLADLHAAGVPGVVVVPIGFVSDHIEVRYDLDTLARETADALGLPMARAATPGTDARFVDMLVELVRERRDDVPPQDRRALSPLGPWPDVCPATCCPGRRGPR
ncbi:MAG: ferrochelatase [Actinomycetia bacterium]|nr:ferrochelatase [Actinomycetes bacterium]